MTALTPPLLSTYDPVESLEGTIDPFRTQALYETLAESVLPFVTARMRRPRFVTAIAAGSLVRRGTRTETPDGRVPAWVAYEWLVVEAIARSGSHDGGEATGIPGLTKVRAARKRGQEVGPATYLKTPKIFGFTGIYRRLGLGMNVLDADLDLDEGGQELLRAWERGTGVPGFVGGQGAGKSLLERLRRALDASLESGHTRGFSEWEELARVLDPTTCTKEEASLLFSRLVDAQLGFPKYDPAAAEMRRELVLAVKSRGPVQRAEEREFLAELECSPALRERLDRILAFEAVCRIVEDAFHHALHLSTDRGHGFIGASEFARTEPAKGLVARLRPALDALDSCFEGLAVEHDVRRTFDRYRAIAGPEELFRVVIEHHKEAQHGKPPEPKRPWFSERGGEIAARMGFARPKPPALSLEFVHEYRLPSVSSFLRDFRGA